MPRNCVLCNAMPQQNFLENVWQSVAQHAAMASVRGASNQTEWQRPQQQTPHSHIAYLPNAVLHPAPLLMPSGRPTAVSGAFQSVLPGCARPPPPPPRRGLSNAQAALPLAGQAHLSLSRGGSLQAAVYQVSLVIGKLLIQKQQRRIAALNGMHPL